jgi:hypothetical protein
LLNVAVQTIRQGIYQMVAKRFFHPALFFRTWLALRVLLVTVPMGMAAPGDRIPGFTPGEHLDLPFPGVRGRVDGFLTSPSRPPVIYGNFREGILGLSSDGSLETKRTPNLARTHCKSAVMLSDGRMVAAGAFKGNWGYAALVRFLPDMRLDPEFRLVFTNTASIQSPERALEQPDGRLLIGGRILEVEGHPASGLVRLFSDGSLDRGFAARLEDRSSGHPVVVEQMALQRYGRILVAGSFDYVWASLYLPRPFQPARPLLLKLRGDAPLLRVRLIGTDQLLIGLNEMPGKSFILETSADLGQWQPSKEIKLPDGGFLEMPVSRTESAQFIRVVPSSLMGRGSENLR